MYYINGSRICLMTNNIVSLYLSSSILRKILPLTLEIHIKFTISRYLLAFCIYVRVRRAAFVMHIKPLNTLNPLC